MTPRVSVKSLNLRQPSRMTVSVTLVPSLPLICFTALNSVMFLVVSPLILTILSPGLRPAWYAGVSSIGETMVRTPFSRVISIPNPPKSPANSDLNSLNIFSVIKEE